MFADVAAAVDDCTVVVVAGVFHGNIFDFGGWRYDNTPEGFSDCLVYSKQSSHSCFVEIIHERYGR